MKYQEKRCIKQIEFGRMRCLKTTIYEDLFSEFRGTFIFRQVRNRISRVADRGAKVRKQIRDRISHQLEVEQVSKPKNRKQYRFSVHQKGNKSSI